MTLLRLFFSPLGRIGRLPFTAAAFAATAVKLTVDWFVTAIVFHQAWRPVEYVWSRSPLFALSDISVTRYYTAMLLIAAPFAWIGVSLCCKRLRSSGAQVWPALFFFVPIVKWFLFATLIVLPDVPARDRPPVDSSHARSWVRATAFRSALAAVLISGIVGALLAWVSVKMLRAYGTTLFLSVPFFLGALATAIHGRGGRRSLGQSIATSLLALALVGALLLTLATEGFVCLLMAAPLAIVENILGAVFAHALTSARWREAVQFGASNAVVLPLLVATEPHVAVRRSVSTTVEIRAEAQTVWQNVIAFGEIAPPHELLFRTGIAYPTRAQIDGAGVGATRHCVFSTGEFVEPITVWNPPAQLAFNVSAQPDPLTELSPYGHIDAPHLRGYFISQRGEFRLVPRANGHTRLTGTTWYVNRISPDAYWHFWTDFIVHSIHRRVLDHIRQRAELTPVAFDARNSSTQTAVR